jgi:hypothetical protein
MDRSNVVDFKSFKGKSSSDGINLKLPTRKAVSQKERVELEPELQALVDRATEKGMEELNQALEIFDQCVTSLDELAIGDFFTPAFEMLRDGWDALKTILEDDIDPEGQMSREQREVYVEAQKERSKYLFKLMEKYKEDK